MTDNIDKTPELTLEPDLTTGTADGEGGGRGKLGKRPRSY